MSFHDAYQSLNCSRQTLGSPRTNNFGDDYTVMRISRHREAELREILSDIPPDLRSRLDRWFQIVVKDEIESSHKNQATTSTHGAGDSESRSLELIFSNKIMSTLVTGDDLKAAGDVPLEVTLVDSRTKEAVKSGVEASGKVEIVVLEAEVDGVIGEDVKSKRKLVRRMEGSKSISVGSLCLNLKQGTAILPRVAFTRNDKWTGISKLRLGAKFVDNLNEVQVKDAKTGSFLLKDTRTKYCNKHPIPFLHDEIWRLYKVSKKGCLAKSLIQAGIITVGDFLVHLFQQRQHLKEIFDHSNHAKSWKTTEQHARTCPAKLHYCSRFDLKTKVFFNVSGKVLGLSHENCFLSRDQLSETQKEFAKNLVISAFENWGDVVHDHEDQNTFGKSVFLNDLDLHIDETCLLRNKISDGGPVNPELLPKSLRRKYIEIYHEFESVCISNRHEQEGAYKNRSGNRWKVLFCVVTFKIRSLSANGLDEIRAHKKARFQ